MVSLAVLEEVRSTSEVPADPEVQAGPRALVDLESSTGFEAPAIPPPTLEEPMDLESLTVIPLTGMPTLPESPAEEPVAVEITPEGNEGNGMVDPEPEVVVVEAPSENWVEEGASLPQGETVAAPEAEPIPPPVEPAIEPLTRPRSSLGRSVDPQKLAKVLEYLLSPADSPPPDFSPELGQVMGLGGVGAGVETPVEGSADVGATEPQTKEGPSLPENREEGPSVSAEDGA